MAYYSIGDVAERCGINPVTLRAWQRRYGLLKPQRSEGGHRLFDEEDIQRIEEIKRWISNGIPVGKVKALLETSTRQADDDWNQLQEEMMSILRMAHPPKLRAKITALGRVHPVDALIDHVYLPVRQRLILDHNTSRIMNSMLDGALIEYVATLLSETRRKSGKDALLLAGMLKTEPVCGSKPGVYRNLVGILPFWLNPLNRQDLNFSWANAFVWTGIAPTRRQNELLQHWNEQGYKVIFHSP